MNKYRIIIGLLMVMIVASNCSKKLDNININDNPYDRDYVGPIVVSKSTITTDTVSYPTMRNTISVTKTINNHDGIRLYRNGVLVSTKLASSPGFPSISDNSAVAFATYTYQLRLFLGSGETESADFSYTTPPW